MRKVLILLALVIFIVSGCGWKEAQIEHQKTQQMAINKHYKSVAKQDKDLLELELDDEGRVEKVTVGDPYASMRAAQGPPVNLRGPTTHPMVKFWKDTVGLASTPLASILGGGLAAKWVAQETGTEINAGGDAAGGDVTKSAGGMAGGDIDSSVDNSDNRANYGNDESDNSDNRSNYGNDESDNSDNRSNYGNDKSDNSVVEQ